MDLDAEFFREDFVVLVLPGNVQHELVNHHDATLQIQEKGVKPKLEHLLFFAKLVQTEVLNQNVLLKVDIFKETIAKPLAIFGFARNFLFKLHRFFI